MTRFLAIVLAACGSCALPPSADARCSVTTCALGRSSDATREEIRNAIIVTARELMEAAR